jgi:glycosyltransferase involved in cell wall biosynthesis
LLSAFDELAAEHDLTLGIVGDGPRSDELRDHAQSLTHSDRVTFHGFVEADRDVYGHMRAADVFALPSVREGFGITVLESMAAGCIPVVASHPNSAATEVVGECGFVAEPDVSPLADTLERALTEGDGAPDPVEHARDFDWDQVSAMAEEVYRNSHNGVASDERPSARGRSA